MPWVGCGGGGGRGGGGDYQWKPRTVEDSIDAGVHPAVAAMRARAAMAPRTVEDAIIGRKVCHIIGQNKAPTLDLSRTIVDPAYNPMNFFRQANKLGLNPLQNVVKTSQPALPKTHCKDKKRKKDKKDSKKKRKRTLKKKHKKRKSSSSSSDSSSSTPSAKKRKK